MTSFCEAIRDEPFNIYRGGGEPKNDKKLFAGGKSWKKLFANSLSKKICLYGNFKEFANFKISACSKDAFLLQLIRQHSITFW